MRPIRLLVALTAALSGAGCDSLELGYVNQLSYPITVVEHGGRDRAPLHLKPGEARAPLFGPIPQSIDVIDSWGGVAAHYRIRDIPRGDGHGSIRYVVIAAHGPEMEFRDHLEYTE